MKTTNDEELRNAYTWKRNFGVEFWENILELGGNFELEY